jgi:hypothetical protein
MTAMSTIPVIFMDEKGLLIFFFAIMITVSYHDNVHSHITLKPLIDLTVNIPYLFGNKILSDIILYSAAVFAIRI